MTSQSDNSEEIKRATEYIVTAHNSNDPDLISSAYYMRALDYEMAGKYALALKDMWVAFEYGREASIIMTYARILSLNGKFEKAVQIATLGINSQSLHHSNDHYLASNYSSRAGYYVALGDDLRAIADYSISISLAERYLGTILQPSIPYRERALAYRRIGELRAAWVDSQSAAKLDPNTRQQLWYTLIKKEVEKTFRLSDDDE